MRLRQILPAILTAKHLPLGLALLGSLLLWPCITGGFQLDDSLQRYAFVAGSGRSTLRIFEFYAGDPAAGLAMRESGWALPWWAPVEFRHRLLRYASAASMQLDYALWPERADLMHIHSLLWLCAVIASAAALYRKLLGPTWIAGFAALLYAIDDAHALPAAYLANRNALLATCFGLLSVLAYVRFRERGSVAAAAVSVVCLALGLASGELAVSAVGYLVAHALFLDRTSARRRLAALAPHAMVLLAWALAYRVGGFGAWGSGFYIDPLGDADAFFAMCFDHLPRLLLGQWTPFAAEKSPTVALRFAALAVTFVLPLLLAPLLRRDAVARFFAAGTLLSLIPAAATEPSNRLLLFVGFGSMGLLSLGASALLSVLIDPARGRIPRVLAGGLCGVLLLTHVVIAPVLGLETVAALKRATDGSERAIRSVPHDPQIAAQDLVLLNPPDYVYGGMAIATVKRLEGAPIARRLRALSAVPGAMSIARPDLHTLEVTLEAGLFTDAFSRYFRSQRLPFRAGERVELRDLSIEIVSMNRAGDPDRIRYRFTPPLEHASLRWLEWRDGRYVPWHPPAVGETTQVPAGSPLFQL